MAPRTALARTTILALVPLALHGGPLWEPLCYAQIGGLTIATFITLLIVPVLYAIFVHDLRLVHWDNSSDGAHDDAAHHASSSASPAGLRTSPAASS